MVTLFISDLHLSTDRPDKLTLFRDLLQGPARQADALYILGDLFDDFWVGCDDETPPNPEILTLLKAYSEEEKTTLYIMRGNRDFHLNEDFVEKSGCELIDDPAGITLGGTKVLIMHGDTLCTDDTQYQWWRRFITNGFIKGLFSYFPLALRKRISHRVRNATVEITRTKSPDIIDVDQATVLRTMRKHQVEVLIHGHTHRQAVHEFDAGGKKLKRIVLGDWYEKDCVLIHDENGFRFERVADYVSRLS